LGLFARCADHSFGLKEISAAGLLARDSALVVLSLVPLLAVWMTFWHFLVSQPEFIYGAVSKSPS